VIEGGQKNVRVQEDLVKKNFPSPKNGKIRKQLAGLALAFFLLLISSLVGSPSPGKAGSHLLPLPMPIILDQSNQSQPMVKPSKGRFLLASRQL